MGRELFVSNVPFFDSLSFPFLAYASFCLARWALGQAHGWAPAALAGALMMLLDVVVDPLAVLGDRWFLGRVFYYAEPGIYFGVPLSNFAGWFLVGWVIVGGYLWVAGRRPRALGSPLGGSRPLLWGPPVQPRHDRLDRGKDPAGNRNPRACGRFSDSLCSEGHFGEHEAGRM